MGFGSFFFGQMRGWCLSDDDGSPQLPTIPVDVSGGGGRKGTRWDDGDPDWGPRIKWRSLDQAYKEASDNERPIMVVVFKGVCSSCNALRQNVGSSEEIARLAEGFVMVNVEDPEDSLPELRPVTYVPRVLFFTPDGKFCEQFYNRLGNPKYKFFYPNATSIAATMKDVLEKYPIHPPVKQL